jgi:hypothetical protein
MKRTLAFGGLALLLTGCAGLLPALSAGASWLGTVLDVAQGGAGAYFARHPNLETEQRVDAAELRARKALAALQAALAAGETDGQVRAEALAAYEGLRVLLGEAGVLDARAPAGGAETEAPPPEPLLLPTVAEVKAHL